MTSQELADLKAEIKAEVLQEIHSSPKGSRHWLKVKSHIEGRLKKVDVYHRGHIVTGISTIIRYSLGLKSIVNLSADQIEQAKAVADQVIDVMETAWQAQRTVATAG